MQSIYNYMPETTHISTVYSFCSHSVFTVCVTFTCVSHVKCFLLLKQQATYRSMCAVPVWQFFCISFISCFPAMLLRNFMNEFEMVPVAPIISGITVVFKFHMRWISVVKALYFRIFSASLLVTFLSPEISTSVKHTFLFNYYEFWCPVYCYVCLSLLLLLLLLLVSLLLLPLRRSGARARYCAMIIH